MRETRPDPSNASNVFDLSRIAAIGQNQSPNDVLFNR